MKKTFLLISAFAATTTLLAQDDLVIYGDVTPDIVWNNFAGPTNVQEVDNPSPDAVNSTAKCISMNRPKETGGSGLGLSIAKYIAKGNNARLELTSELHKGTTVTAIFPRHYETKKDTDK